MRDLMGAYAIVQMVLYAVLMGALKGLAFCVVGRAAWGYVRRCAPVSVDIAYFVAACAALIWVLQK